MHVWAHCCICSADTSSVSTVTRSSAAEAVNAHAWPGPRVHATWLPVNTGWLQAAASRAVHVLVLCHSGLVESVRKRAHCSTVS
jgi:hypothetical protein